VAGRSRRAGIHRPDRDALRNQRSDQSTVRSVAGSVQSAWIHSGDSDRQAGITTDAVRVITGEAGSPTRSGAWGGLPWREGLRFGSILLVLILLASGWVGARDGSNRCSGLNSDRRTNPPGAGVSRHPQAEQECGQPQSDRHRGHYETRRFWG